MKPLFEEFLDRRTKLDLVFLNQNFKYSDSIETQLSYQRGLSSKNSKICTVQLYEVSCWKYPISLIILPKLFQNDAGIWNKRVKLLIPWLTESYLDYHLPQSELQSRLYTFSRVPPSQCICTSHRPETYSCINRLRSVKYLYLSCNNEPGNSIDRRKCEHIGEKALNETHLLRECSEPALRGAGCKIYCTLRCWKRKKDWLTTRIFAETKAYKVNRG